MKYNEKRSLYESIMNDVAKSVKRHLNEDSTQQNYIEYNGLNELKHYADEILKEAAANVHNHKLYIPVARQTHAVNDKNVYIFVIKKEDRIEFDRPLIEKIIDCRDKDDVKIHNLSHTLTKSSFTEADLFFLINETNEAPATAKAIQSMMAIADGQVQDIKLNKKPHVIYVTMDESILNNAPLMRRVSKVFVQKQTQRERYGNDYCFSW